MGQPRQKLQEFKECWIKCQMVLYNQNANNNQVKKTMHNKGLLIMNKPKMHQDSYFEMCTLYYCSFKKVT